MNKIEELENKMLEIAQEIAELKKDQNAGESIEWKPQKGEMYWYMDFDGEPDNLYFNPSHRYDIWRVNNIPVFKTQEECQKYCDYRKALIEKSYKFTREEWNNNNIVKYSIMYNYARDRLDVDNNVYFRSLNKVYFKTEDDAQYMIDNYSDEILKWGLL